MESNKKRVISNMSWLVGGKVINMILQFFVSLATARYLGADHFGEINYVAAYVSFFSSIASLGLAVIVIKEVSRGKQDPDAIIWTGIWMRFATAILSTVTVVAVVSISNQNDPLLQKIAVLESLAIIFSSFDTFMYWFQGKLLAKYVSISGTLAYLGKSLYNIYLLAHNADIVWFAFATSVDTIFLALFLFLFYIKCNGFHPTFSWKTGKALLRESYHYMISGLVAVAYSQIDRIMLKSMLNSTSVGLYSASLTIAGMWSIIPSAIIQSVTPVLYRNADENYPLFIRRLRQSYALIWGLNVLWSVGISVLNYWVVYLLYGSDYMGARGSLVIGVWYTGIASLGSLTQVYLATGNKNKYVNYFAVAGLFTDVVLNALLIPRFGIEGAAVATLATYCVIHIIMPVVFRDTREAGKLILEAMIFRNVVDDDMKQFVRKLILKKAG
jgi:O-antigen/teichoic acid export membrane protein